MARPVLTGIATHESEEVQVHRVGHRVCWLNVRPPFCGDADQVPVHAAAVVDAVARRAGTAATAALTATTNRKANQYEDLCLGANVSGGAACTAPPWDASLRRGGARALSIHRMCCSAPSRTLSSLRRSTRGNEEDVHDSWDLYQCRLNASPPFSLIHRTFFTRWEKFTAASAGSVLGAWQDSYLDDCPFSC